MGLLAAASRVSSAGSAPAWAVRVAQASPATQEPQAAQAAQATWAPLAVHAAQAIGTAYSLQTTHPEAASRGAQHRQAQRASDPVSLEASDCRPLPCQRLHHTASNPECLLEQRLTDCYLHSWISWWA